MPEYVCRLVCEREVTLEIMGSEKHIHAPGIRGRAHVDWVYGNTGEMTKA